MGSPSASYRPRSGSWPRRGWRSPSSPPRRSISVPLRGLSPPPTSRLSLWSRA